MKSLDFGRCVLGGFAAAAMLAGCGGSQPPVGAPGAIPQTGTAQARAHGAPGSSDALIYASGGCGGICVLSYPNGNLVASIQVTGGAGAPCSDNAGNVFVPSQSQVLEYQHGGTRPRSCRTLVTRLLEQLVDRRDKCSPIQVFGRSRGIKLCAFRTGEAANGA
jgi:hypothetical protein